MARVPPHIAREVAAAAASRAAEDRCLLGLVALWACFTVTAAAAVWNLLPL